MSTSSTSLGIDVEPTADDHVLLPVDDVEEAVGVAECHVAGQKPPVTQCRGGLLPDASNSRTSRSVIAHRSRRPRRWALISRRRRESPPARPRPGCRRNSSCRFSGSCSAGSALVHPGALGLAVRLHQDRAENLLHFDDPSGRHRRRAVDEGLEGTQIETVDPAGSRASRIASSAR